MFKSLSILPPDPTFKLFHQFLADANPKKVNLGIGLYTDHDGKPFVLKTVKKAFKEVDTSNFNYQPIGGNRQFLELVAQLIFGSSYDPDHIAMQATCGGTQACRVFADLSQEVLHHRTIQIGMPSWVNYFALFQNMEIQQFDHLKPDGTINFEAHIAAAKRAPDHSAYLLQGGLAHNPSGLNLSLDQLKELTAILEERNSILYMDMAYFGLSEGIETDRQYLQYCFENLERFAVGVSFSKNASLYEQRCGALFVKTVNTKGVETHLQQSIRQSISTPPGIGQEIMLNMLANYQQEWQEEVAGLLESINSRRQALIAKLPQTPAFQALLQTKGMFGLLPLTPAQVLKLRQDFAIYVLDNGRINFSGIKDADIDYIAEGINAVS